MTLLSRRHHHESSGVANGVAAEGHPQAEHGHTEDYASAGAHAAVSQAFRELTDRRNMQALTGMLQALALCTLSSDITLAGM